MNDVAVAVAVAEPDPLAILDDSPAPTSACAPSTMGPAAVPQEAVGSSIGVSPAPAAGPVSTEKSLAPITIPERRVTLFDLEREYLEIVAFFDEASTDSFTPDADDKLRALAERLVQVQEAVGVKVEGWAKWIRSIEADADSAALEAKRLAVRANSFSKLADKLRDLLKNAMIAMDTSKVKTPLFTVTVKKAPASVASVNVLDLPTRFMHPPAPPEPNKKAILDAWKASGAGTAESPRRAPPGVVIKDDGRTLEIR